jgi:Viral BACON domain/Putative binding domain, N-terminal
LSCAACDSSAKTTLGPSSFVKCQVTASATPASFPPEGGGGQLTVAAERECAWSVKPGAAWVTVSPPDSGQGPSSVQFTVGANVDPSPRSATLTVNDQQVAIAQQPGVCRYQLSSTAANVPSGGGSGAIDVTASSGACEWSARSDTAWVTIRSGASGRGNGRVTFDVAPMSGPPRAGTITVADQTVAVTQGDGCAFTIAPTDVTLGAGGGTGEVNVTTDAGCGWSAASNAPWISITSGASGIGSGPVRFSVAPVAGPARSGTLTVAGRSVTVVQQTGCTVTIDPMTRTFEAAGGAGTVHVASPAGCEWRATSNVAWITIRGGATGAGVGDVSFDVGLNGGPQRSGTLTIGSLTFTVMQNGSCTYQLGSDFANVPSGGGAGSVAVTAGAGCAWTATADPTTPWLRITSGASGTGAGVVEFTADPNPGAPRSAALTIAGQTFTVNQSSGCSYGVTPAGISVPAAGGSDTITVTTPAQCTWTASTTTAWLSITSGSAGTGSGAVQFTAVANAGPARSGAIAVAGSTVTIDQSSGCAFAIAPASQAFKARGGQGAIAVTAGADCAWTATSAVAWITITSGASGSGNGSVTFTVAENTEEAARSGTITVADQTFTVMQVASEELYFSADCGMLIED